MYTSIKGYYENGQIFLEEPAPVTEKMDVIIIFLAETESKASEPEFPEA